MGNATVKKSLAERYDVRTERRGEWAVIMVDDRGGMLNIQSDYGTWGHSWSHPGKPFKQFLTEIDADYLMGKLGRRDYFHGDKTAIEVKREIARRRRAGEIEVAILSRQWRDDDEGRDDDTKTIARLAFDAADEIGSCANTEEMMGVYHHSGDLRKVFPDICELPIVIDYDPSLVMFCDRIWPAFIDHLKTELAAAAA